MSTHTKRSGMPPTRNSVPGLNMSKRLAICLIALWGCENASKLDHVNAKGMALIPLRIFFNAKGLAKVQLGVGKGKNVIDKRETLKRKTADREIHRALADRTKRRSQS